MPTRPDWRVKVTAEGEQWVARLRDEQIGGSSPIATPFGIRPLVYADYAASGRGLGFVEDALRKFQTLYANPHSEDSATGRAVTAWLTDATHSLKKAVNAGPGDCLLFCGTGATAAIHKLQEILGVAIPPATRERLGRAREYAAGIDESGLCAKGTLRKDRPVVFTGPYEHHSNELTWRESLAEVVSISLTQDGAINLDHLRLCLENPVFENRLRIGAFSAASNVTGVKTDITALIRLLHDYHTIACIDYAAGAPYLPIDMNPAGDPAARPDAVAFSPHKFLGGPGASGVLIFKEALYNSSLAPTVCGGGTVGYVWPDGHDFLTGIEAREAAGTPGVLQVVRGALAMQLLDRVGFDLIEAREQMALRYLFDRWSDVEGIEILGPLDPAQRVGIVSFNLRDPRGGLLHPRFVTTLLNDLFGIQARGGCSCAGPYGHHLLDIDDQETLVYREHILDGHVGLRPGWCRISAHYIMSEAEIAYIAEAVVFIAQQGSRFLDLYNFDVTTGRWRHHEQSDDASSAMSVEAAWANAQTPFAPPKTPCPSFEQMLSDALAIAETLPELGAHPSGQLSAALDSLRYFSLPSTTKHESS